MAGDDNHGTLWHIVAMEFVVSVLVLFLCGLKSDATLWTGVTITVIWVVRR